MRWLLLVPVILFVVLFALSNRQSVTVALWPSDLAWQAPLAVAVLAMAALAFLLGAATVWVTALAHRRRARQAAEAIRRLERELEAFRVRDRTAEAVRLTAPGG